MLVILAIFYTLYFARQVILPVTIGVLLNFLFQRGESPPCLKAADSNDNGRLEVTDAIRVIRFLFGGQGSFPPPATCGPDPSADVLGCESFPGCEE